MIFYDYLMVFQSFLLATEGRGGGDGGGGGGNRCDHPLIMGATDWTGKNSGRTLEELWKTGWGVYLFHEELSNSTEFKCYV